MGNLIGQRHMPIFGSLAPRVQDGLRDGTLVPAVLPAPTPSEVQGFAMAEALGSVLPTLAGGGIVLRPLDLADEGAWRATIARNAPALRDVGMELDDDGAGIDFEQRIAGDELAAVLDLGYGFGVFLDGAFIGEAALLNIQRGGVDSGVCSLWIDTDHRAAGHGRAALILTMGLGFDALDLHRVEALVLPEAVGTHGMFGALGVEPRGVEPEAARVNGEWRDHLRYVVLESTWTEHSPRWKQDWL